MAHSFYDARLSENSLQYLKGVGEKRAAALNKLGIFSAMDLLEYYPHRYLDFSFPGTFASRSETENTVVRVRVLTQAQRIAIRPGLTLYKTGVIDNNGQPGYAVFFNSEYAASGLTVGKEYFLLGRITHQGTHAEIASPEYIPADNPTRICPIYGQSAGISTRVIEKLITARLAELGEPEDPIPEEYRKSYNLCGLGYALQNIHHPESMEALDTARRRLAFGEMLTFQLAMSHLRKGIVHETTAPLKPCDLQPFYASLPYILTGAQRRAIDEAAADLQKPVPMNRLLQGDVGSGKTVVAAALVYMAAQSGGQAALLAPTELLATQHLATMTAFLAPLGFTVALVTGKTGKREREAIAAGLADGTVHLLIGTHALFYREELRFVNLSLAITDEQHRFGVRQRAALAQKGGHPHILVMSATPIPRTLALMLYGDLDISVLDELPAGRQEIVTALRGEEAREKIDEFIKKQLSMGRQAYIVCPSIEEGDNGLKAATSHYEDILKKYGGYTAALLHGKMRPAEKEKVMAEFAAGRIQMLVSTTVIEVGIDQPNATVMLIENAERFGLAQLHQLRGRVGRGKHRSYCILMSDSEGEKSSSRLELLQSTTNGFVIADADLKMRGPGEFLGSRQSGAIAFKLSGVAGDIESIRLAGQLAALLVQQGLDEKPPLSLLIEELIDNITRNGLN